MAVLSLIPEHGLPPVLVTGGAGYIGSHAALALLDLGVPVVVLDDMSTGSRLQLPAGAVHVAGRAGDAALVRRIVAEHGIGAAMHFAASISVAESIARPATYYANNFAETVAFADALVAAGVKALVFSSTAAVYGDAGSGAPLPETAPIAPINPYGHSKAMAEQALRDIAAASGGLSLAVLRYFNVAGADPAGRSGQASHHPHHLIELATQVITGQRTEFTIFGDDYATPDGTGVRDYVHVSDVASAHVMLLRACLAAPGQQHCFNLGYGHGHSVKQVLAALADVAGQPIPTRTGPRRAGDPAQLVAATDALRAAGWVPAHDDLPAMLGHALAWERKRLTLAKQTGG